MLPDDEFSPHVQLPPDLALDLDGIRNLELAFHPGVFSDHREESHGLPVLGFLRDGLFRGGAATKHLTPPLRETSHVPNFPRE